MGGGSLPRNQNTQWPPDGNHAHVCSVGGPGQEIIDFGVQTTPCLPKNPRERRPTLPRGFWAGRGGHLHPNKSTISGLTLKSKRFWISGPSPASPDMQKVSGCARGPREHLGSPVYPETPGIPKDPGHTRSSDRGLSLFLTRWHQLY